MTINERMQYIVDERFNGNKASFAKAIGIAPTSISNYLSKSRASKPTSDILGEIINVVHDLNASWLLTGKGDPFFKIVDEDNKIIDDKWSTLSNNEDIGEDQAINENSEKEVSQYQMPTVGEMIKVISLLSEQGKENAEANKINAEANRINAEANDRNSKNMERMMEMLERMLQKELLSQKEESKSA